VTPYPHWHYIIVQVFKAAPVVVSCCRSSAIVCCRSPWVRVALAAQTGLRVCK